jgi:anti-anti-sigma regulatory factor
LPTGQTNPQGDDFILWTPEDPSDSPCTIEVQLGDPVLLTVQGELDLAEAAALDGAFRRIPPHWSVRLNLAGVSFCDLTGLRTILAEFDRRPAMVTESVSPAIERLSAMLGLAPLTHRVGDAAPAT